MNDMFDGNVVNEKEYYIFSNKELENYDIVQTKENVENLFFQYKEAKFTFFASEKALKNISMNFNPKYNQNMITANDKVGDNVCKKVDSYNFIKSFDEVLNPLLEILSPHEKKYYLYCIANENSEQTVADIIGISRTGLQPIKNNCILKFGLAFQVAIRKKNTSL